MLTITTFGGLSIYEDEGTLCKIGSRKAEAILIYIALEECTQRKFLADLFWPNSNEKRALSSLRTAISALNRKIGDYLDITSETISIKKNLDIQIDAKELEKCIMLGQTDKAIALYKADFLSGFFVRDSSGFESWQRHKEQSLKDQLINLMRSSLMIKLASKDYKKAQNIAINVINLDPLDESSFQHYMLALALAGQRTTALEQYKKFAEILNEELGVHPGEETENIRKYIQDGSIQELLKYLKNPGNLPNPISKFIGRESEIRQITKKIKEPDCRLVTITGIGGVGKTRLSIQVARNLMIHYPDGVFFISMEQISCLDQLTPHLAEAMHFRFDSVIAALDPFEQLCDFLKHRSVLFILDGFESHLNQVGFVSKLLSQTDRLKILITSRQILDIPGEWKFHITGLPLLQEREPNGDSGTSSFDLFKERAKQNAEGFSFSPEETKSALQICRMVEGSPLGIELAASWTSVLSCGEIAGKIEKNFGFLKVLDKNPLEKHNSLRAVFNQSWDLLDESMQNELSALSIFPGEFNHHSARDAVNVSLDHLTLLVNRSLVRRTGSGNFSMHRAIHQFSRENLEKDKNRYQQVKEKYCRYFTDFLLDREEKINGLEMVSARSEIRSELSNVREAVKLALVNWEFDRAKKVLSGFLAFCLVHGWFESVIELDSLLNTLTDSFSGVDIYDHPLYLICSVHQAYFMTNLGMAEESDAISNKALEPLKTLGMDMEYALCLHNLGVNSEFRGEYELAKKLLEKSIRIGKKKASIFYPSIYLWLGYLYFLLGEYKAGINSFEICLVSYRKHGHLLGIAFSLSKMGLAYDGMEKHQTAFKYHKEALKVFTETNDIVGQGYSLSRMCIGSNLFGDFSEAKRAGVKGLKLFSDIRHRWGINAVRCHLGYSHIGLNKLKTAKRYFLDALTQAIDHHMIPLCLYAISGLAVIHKLNGDDKMAADLFVYIQEHPKTPALYIKQARYFFKEVKNLFTDERKNKEELQDIKEVAQTLLI